MFVTFEKILKQSGLEKCGSFIRLALKMLCV